ncbi:MAG: hypothetical protein ACPGRZ_08465 [Alphaproteobacteria bacterium]
MPSIEISDHVLSMIEKLKLAASESENDVLKRTLGNVLDDRAERLKEYEKLEPDDHSTN